MCTARNFEISSACRTSTGMRRVFGLAIRAGSMCMEWRHALAVTAQLRQERWPSGATAASQGPEEASYPWGAAGAPQVQEKASYPGDAAGGPQQRPLGKKLSPAPEGPQQRPMGKKLPPAPERPQWPQRAISPAGAGLSQQGHDAIPCTSIRLGWRAQTLSSSPLKSCMRMRSQNFARCTP